MSVSSVTPRGRRQPWCLSASCKDANSRNSCCLNMRLTSVFWETHWGTRVDKPCTLSTNLVLCAHSSGEMAQNIFSGNTTWGTKPDVRRRWKCNQLEETVGVVWMINKDPAVNSFGCDTLSPPCWAGPLHHSSCNLRWFLFKVFIVEM